MGQKTNPIGIRVGIIRGWESNWISDKKDYAKFLHEDIYIRKYIFEKGARADVGKVYIERPSPQVINITVHTAKPGILIGKKGATIQEIKEHIEKKTKRTIRIDTREIKIMETNAFLVAKHICLQLQKRSSFRRAMKMSVTRAIQRGAVGAKVLISGRIGGAEIARSEHHSDGKVPLHTLRANIDYGFAEAKTTYGLIGVKVWINKGEVAYGQKVEV
ncbi:30S ribosomal protein S3 [bacterium]|nr:30S ribosomal protein S3 [bacterium]